MRLGGIIIPPSSITDEMLLRILCHTSSSASADTPGRTGRPFRGSFRAVPAQNRVFSDPSYLFVCLIGPEMHTLLGRKWHFRTGSPELGPGPQNSRPGKNPEFSENFCTRQKTGFFAIFPKCQNSEKNAKNRLFWGPF